MNIQIFSVKMFAKLIMEFIDYENLIDYYGRISIRPGNDPTTVLRTHLGWTFKSNKVYKIPLNEIDLEKLNKTYLLFSNGMQTNEHRFQFILFDEFIKNIPMKSSFKISEEIENNFFTGKYKRNFLLKSLIVIEEFLDYDKKYINIYCNSNCYSHIKKMLEINHVKWYKKTEEDKKIINKGVFKNTYIRKMKLNTLEEIQEVTLNDVLKIIPLKIKCYESWRNTNKLKIDEIMIDFYYHVELNPDLKIEFINHLRKILEPLFQEENNFPEETAIDEYDNFKYNIRDYFI